MTILLADVAGENHWNAQLLSLLAIPILILVNGFFVAAEFALVAVRKTRIEELVLKGVRSARAVETAIRSLDRSIAATQLGITLASIALGWVGEPVLVRLIEPWLNFVPDDFRLVTAHTFAVALAFTLITFMHVIFGELMPKSIALQTPDRVALLVAPPLNLFTRLSSPIIALMNGTGNFLLRLMGFRLASGEESVHSLEELSLLIEDTEEAGLLDEEQAELVQNVFRLSHKRVRDCMVPRDKMAMLELNTPPDKILEAVREGAHTRMPVYEGTPDNIVGIVNTKDLFHVMSLHGLVLLDDALYPAVYLDPDESIDTALRLFKQSRKPMALVRDQSGTILGLITLEDVIEEIVGDLEDEHDRPTPKMRTRPKATAGSNASGRSPRSAPATPAAATPSAATPTAAATPAVATPSATTPAVATPAAATTPAATTPAAATTPPPTGG